MEREKTKILLSPTKRRNRNIILRAFATLLDEMDYERIRIQNVAKEAGIAKSTFYQYFSDKDDLCLAFLNALARECEDLFLSLKTSPKREEKEQKIALFASRNRANYRALAHLDEPSFSAWHHFEKAFATIHGGDGSLKKEIENVVYLLYIKRLLEGDEVSPVFALKSQRLSQRDWDEVFDVLDGLFGI